MHGVYAADETWERCASKSADSERLRCYDTLNSAQIKSSTAEKNPGTTASVPRSHLTRAWDLDNKEDDLLGEEQSPLRPHRVSYLIARRSSDANFYSHSPLHSASTSPADIDLNELKFQISQKAKVFNAIKIHSFGITNIRLWGAYTQQSNWQAFNVNNSSPFRETNYEPELILTASTGNQYGLKLINLGYVHQSNGRDLSGSRSWNRFYLQGGWENDTVSALLRGWWRVPENVAEDDNSDIEEYFGRAEISLRWEPLGGSQVIDLTLRNNLRADTNRGFIQVDWATPFAVSKSAKLHIQFTSGYGESLIDYNYFQTTLGLGVSFRDW
jgi:phospholipase A1